jgi:hypothetical protein
MAVDLLSNFDLSRDQREADSIDLRTAKQTKGNNGRYRVNDV